MIFVMECGGEISHKINREVVLLTDQPAIYRGWSRSLRGIGRRAGAYDDLRRSRLRLYNPADSLWFFSTAGIMRSRDLGQRIQVMLSRAPGHKLRDTQRDVLR